MIKQFSSLVLIRISLMVFANLVGDVLTEVIFCVNFWIEVGKKTLILKHKHAKKLFVDIMVIHQTQGSIQIR